MNNIFTCEQVSKTYYDGNEEVCVLKNINLSIKKGERVAIVGPSGSGKSTLLHLLGGLDNPTSGRLTMNGVDWSDLSEKQRCQHRNEHLGFIYQFHHLLSEFTALENAAFPLLIRNEALPSVQQKAASILASVGLAERLHHRPAQLSGGERQRVAIARALIHQPHCVLADEPTGNLDNATATKVFSLMLELNEKFNTALIIVTHDHQLAARMDKVFIIQNGEITTQAAT